MTQLADIFASVGEKGVNRENDVSMVQGLLNSKGFKSGRVDGRCGTKTIEAIKRFQATFLKQPDGLVEPQHATWAKADQRDFASSRVEFAGVVWRE